MNNFRSFAFGMLTTLAVAGALFGSRAVAQVPQMKAGSTHLITIQEGTEIRALSVDLVDKIDAWEVEEGKYEVHISAVSDLSGEANEIYSGQMTKSAIMEFIKEVNKYRP